MYFHLELDAETFHKGMDIMLMQEYMWNLDSQNKACIGKAYVYVLTHKKIVQYGKPIKSKWLRRDFYNIIYCVLLLSTEICMYLNLTEFWTLLDVYDGNISE